MAAVPLAFLDLAPASAGRSRKDALDDALAMARTCEDTGYARYWMAEHHGSAAFMSSATSLLLARAAEHTSTIRLGAGGVMLPNHAPLMVAEYYGTLATIYGPRFDLGLGRAPGTDSVTAQALRRGSADTFADDVAALLGYLAPASEPASGGGVSGAEAAALGLTVPPDEARRRVRAIPGEGEDVSAWILGSSLAGAAAAAGLGLPFAVASHFAPAMAGQALACYREQFSASAPTAQIGAPYTMAGVNVLAAPTHREACELFSTYMQFKRGLGAGHSRPLPPPLADAPWSGSDGIDPRAIVGEPGEVADQVAALVERWGVDEVVVTTYAWDPEARRRSARLLAEAWGRG